jgi:hypothetical protein
MNLQKYTAKKAYGSGTVQRSIVTFRRRVKGDVQGDLGRKTHKPGSKRKSLSTQGHI